MSRFSEVSKDGSFYDYFLKGYWSKPSRFKYEPYQVDTYVESLNRSLFGGKVLGLSNIYSSRHRVKNPDYPLWQIPSIEQISSLALRLPSFIDLSRDDDFWFFDESHDPSISNYKQFSFSDHKLPSFVRFLKSKAKDLRQIRIINPLRVICFRNAQMHRSV